MHKTFLPCVLVLCVAACGGDTADDDAADDDTADDDTADDDTADDDTADDDTADDDTADDDTADDDDDTGHRTGITGRHGEAVASAAGYVGQEELYLIGDEGRGDEICRVRYDLRPAGAMRTDCADCAWAFDLEVDNAAIVAESDVGCAALGYAPSDVGSLNGTVVSYGYVEEYLGHASVLVQSVDGGVWAAVAFAAWDATSGAFSYDREDGTLSY